MPQVDGQAPQSNDVDVDAQGLVYVLDRVRGLDAIAKKRGQTLAQMAIAWTLRDQRVTTALVGASRWSQIEDSLGALDNLEFTAGELAEIDRYAVDSGINLWEASSRED